MSEKHTPRPWNMAKHATPDYAPQYGIYAGEEVNDFCIVRGDNAEANARLITAAPALLEACEDGIKFLDSLLVGNDVTETQLRMLSENRMAFRKILIAAIAQTREVGYE